MEAVAALFAAATTATAATAAAGAGATLSTAAMTTAGATAAATAATTASSVWGALQGAATTASIISSLVGGTMALGQGLMQSQLSEMEAGQIKLASEQRAIEIKKQTLKAIGATRVAFAGSGLDLSSADAIEQDLQGEAAYATGIERQNAVLRSIAAQRRGDAAEVRGYGELAGSVGRAATQAAGYGLDLARRG